MALLATIGNIDRLRQITQVLVKHGFGELVARTEGLAWARNPRSGGSQEQPDIPPEEERKIGDTAGRIKRGKRMIFEISPDEVGMVQDVREA